MPPFSMLKRTARESLGGSWGKAILVLLIYSGASGVITALQLSSTYLLVPPTDPAAYAAMNVDEYLFNTMFGWNAIEALIVAAFTVINILLLSPLALGITYWFQSRFSREQAAISDVFRAFESGGRYLRAVWLEVNLSVRSLGWMAVFFIVPVAVYAFALRALIDADKAGMAAQSAMASAGLLLGAVLLLLAAIFCGALLNRYFLAPYLLNEDDALTVREAVKTSVAYTKGYRFRILGFQLSFILWFLLSCLCLFLPFFYVLPYYRAANAAFARYIIDQNRYQPPTDATREFLV